MDIIKAHAKKNLCYIAAQKMTPKGIVVHSTGANNPYLKRYVDAPDKVGKNTGNNHWNVAKPNGNMVCVHAFIGYDRDGRVRVAEILPLDICCWGVGSGKKGSYNFDPAYIQFEICEDDLSNRDYYKKAFSVAAEYCAELCRKYGISTQNIVGHCEAYRKGYGSNHADPEHWMKKFHENMDDFRSAVKKQLKNTAKPDSKGGTAKKENTFSKGDLVSVTGNAVYYGSSETIPQWVKAQKWYIKEVSGENRIIIDANEKGTVSICSPIHKKYLKLIKSAKGKKQDKASGKTNKKFVPYTVKITADQTYIFKEPDQKSQKVGKISDKGVYTIVKEKTDRARSKWGQLKSGVGWIRLCNVKKLR